MRGSRQALLLVSCAAALGVPPASSGAAAEVREAIEARDQHDPLVLHNTATVAIVRGDLAEAETALAKLVERDPDNLQSVLEHAVVQTARAPEQGASIWKRVRERCSWRSDAPARDLCGLAENAVRHAQGDGHLDAAELLAMARVLLDRHPLAAATLLGAGERLAPTDPAFPYLRAQALEKSGYARSASAALVRAAAIPQPASSVLDIPPAAIDFEAGRVAAKTDRAMDAVHYLERARSARSGLPNVEYMLGRSYAAVGDRAAAEREYTACLSRAHNTGESQALCRKNRRALSRLDVLPAPSEAFETALAEARTFAASESGAAYEAGVARDLGPRFDHAVDTCVSRVAPGGSEPRHLLLRVAVDGTVTEVLQQREDGEPRCFATQLHRVHVRVPPGDGAWLEYRIASEN